MEQDVLRHHALTPGEQQVDEVVHLVYHHLRQSCAWFCGYSDVDPVLAGREALEP